MRGKALERAILAQKVTPRDLDERVTKVRFNPCYGRCFSYFVRYWVYSNEQKPLESLSMVLKIRSTRQRSAKSSALQQPIVSFYLRTTKGYFLSLSRRRSQLLDRTQSMP